MKMIFVLTVIPLFLGTLFLSTVGAQSNEYAKGKALYQENCQSCHGEKGKGNGPMSSGFSPPPANFTNPDFWKNSPDKRITNAVANGYKQMPPIGLTPDQTKEIIDYMSQTFRAK